MKPFEYLNGLTAADDAPLMDNPARVYCPPCRQAGKQHCSDPGMCGQMRPMRPLHEQEAVPPPRIAHTPRPGSKELQGRPRLDDSPEVKFVRRAAEKTVKRVRSMEELGQMFPERLMGRRTTFTALPDGEEKDYAWFMENITKDLEGM